MDISFANAVGIPERAIVSVRVGDQRRQQSYKDNCSLRFDPSQNAKQRVVVDVFERVGTKKIWLADLAGEGSELSDRIVVPRMYGDSKPPVLLDMKVLVDNPGSEEGKRPSSAVKRHQNAIKTSSYIDQHGVQSVLTSMMQVVLVQQPQDPVAFMSKYLADYAQSCPQERQCSDPAPPPPVAPKPELDEVEPIAKSCKPELEPSWGTKSASLPTIVEQNSDAVADTFKSDVSQRQEVQSLRTDLRQAFGKALEADLLLNLLQHAVDGKTLSSPCQTWLDQHPCSSAAT